MVLQSPNRNQAPADPLARPLGSQSDEGHVSHTAQAVVPGSWALLWLQGKAGSRVKLFALLGSPDYLGSSAGAGAIPESLLVSHWCPRHQQSWAQ